MGKDLPQEIKKRKRTITMREIEEQRNKGTEEMEYATHNFSLK